MGPTLAINWKYFSLEQVNNQQEPDWKIWDQPDDYPTRGVRAFRAAESARRQGEATFEAFHLALLRARHEQRQDIADVSTLVKVAESVNLDIDRFQNDLNDRSLLTKLSEDHSFAAETLGIFGTPTLVFPEGEAMFLKMSPPPPEESISVFTEVSHLAEQRHNIQEVKRPQPPKK